MVFFQHQIMAAPYALTEDGYEAQWQTDYLSPLLLIKSLLPTMTTTARKKGLVRIINVVSDAAYLPITPDLDLENPNLDHLTGFMGPWYISLQSTSLDSMLKRLMLQEAILPLQKGNGIADASPAHPLHPRWP